MIESFLKYLEDELSYSSHTLAAYRNDLEQWREFISPDADAFNPADVTTNDIRAWVAALSREGRETSSIKRKLSSVRGFYRFLVKRHGAEANPATSVRIQRRSKTLPKFIDTFEMAEVLDSMDDEAARKADFIAVRDDLILNMLYQTGMRASEITGLTDDRVDLTRSELKVLGKRNKERVIPIGESLRELIARYLTLRARPAMQGRAFYTDENGNDLNYNKLYRIVKGSLDGRVSSSKRSPHVLRHSFATDMLNGGADLTSVRKLLGHTSLATTQIYTHVSVNELYENYYRAHPRAQKK